MYALLLQTLFPLVIINSTLVMEMPAEVTAVIQQAEADGVPTEALQDKAREGLAKGVPGPRVAAVLDGLRGDLLDAQTLLGSDVHGEILAAAAASARAGASDAGLRQLGQLEEGTRALESLADLLRLGFSEDQATRLIEAAVRSEDAKNALTGLATAASLLLDAGSPPGSVIDQLSADVAQGGSPLMYLPPVNVDSSGASNGNNGNAFGQNSNGNGNNGNGAGNVSNSGNNR